MLTLQNYINGQLIEPATGEYLNNVEPATGEVYSRVPHSGEDDVERAVAAADDAFENWSNTPAAERARYLIALADLVERDVEALARAESIDTGKPVALARAVDIPRAAENLRFFATAVQHWSSEAHITEGGVMASSRALNYTLRQPRGVAACISPWNLPLYLFTWKIAPALATGNTVVGKPSEVTPVTAYRLAELAIEAGFPAGVLNIVHGLGSRVGAALVTHPRVPAVSFTGGTATGAWIAHHAGPLFKKVSLELGGKNPNIVFDDCAYDEALSTSVRAAFTNQGEICLCGSRQFVQRSIYDRFVDDFVSKTKALRVGDPMLPDTQVGAMVSQQHFDKVMGCIETARKEGAVVQCGGDRYAVSELNARCARGFFIRPTVITGLDHACRTNQEEIFGPVVTLIPFDTEEEVIAMANSTAYGLSASVWTQNVSRAHRVAAAIDAGTVWVNTWLLRDLRVPFGGTKQSGLGREGGEEALRFFTEAKNVCVKM